MIIDRVDRIETTIRPTMQRRDRAISAYQTSVSVCQFCNELEKGGIGAKITQIMFYDTGYLNWDCMIKYCPMCGKKLHYGGK